MTDTILAVMLLASAGLGLWRWCRMIGVFWTPDDPEFYGCSVDECSITPAQHCCKRDYDDAAAQIGGGS